MTEEHAELGAAWCKRMDQLVRGLSADRRLWRCHEGCCSLLSLL